MPTPLRPSSRHLLRALAIIPSLVVLGASARAADLGYTDTPLIPGQTWHVHDSGRPLPRVVTPGTASTPERPGAPPSDAIVLFDGSDTSHWTGSWKVEDGALVVGKGDNSTKDAFGDIQLHIEWATPKPPKGDSQGRGNSGIFLMGRYEFQVLDCYENKTYADGHAAALYGQWPPLVNACRPPGEWQTYDIVFIAPRFADDGSVKSPARITALHNGVLVQHDQAYNGPTHYKSAQPYAAHPPTAPLRLQDHGNPVRYRNIWVRPLKGYDER